MPMPFPINQDPRYFCLAGFEAILTRALARGYRIVPFCDFEPPDHHPVLLLRHDLDGPLGGARAIAELEARLGVRATYFAQTASDFYNLLSTKSRALLRDLVALGHEVGLHYEASRYAGADGDAALRSDLRLLEDLTGQPVRSASQHIPIDGDAVALDRYVLHEAYAPRFTDPPMTYISDSLMAWRQATPHDLLDRGVSFQLLTHPETWAGNYRDMAEALAGMMAEEIDAVRARYKDVVSYYAGLIETRAERDRRFVDARRKSPRTIGAP
jgi:hypothetical protein